MAYKSLTGFDASSQNIINVADPSSAQHAATKAYVDNSLLGLQWKQPARVASTATVTISNPGTAVFDGITLSSGDRILLKNQTAPAENGIYTFTASGTAMVRAIDNDSVAEMKSATVFIAEGSTNSDKAYTQTAEVVTLNTTGVVWAQFGAGTAYVAGDGLSESPAGTFNVNMGAGLETNADTLRIAASAAGAGLTGGAGSALAVGAGLGITVNADDVALASSTAGAGLTYTSGVLDVVGDASITVGANSLGLATGVAGNGLTLTSGVLAVTNSDGSITVGADTVSVASQVAGAGLTLTAGVLDVVGDASITVAANSLGLAAGVAGAGLTLTSGVLDIVGGGTTGITVSANSIAVDSSVARKYTQTVGDGSSTSIAITHNLGTRAIVWQLYDSTSFAELVCDAVRTSTTVLTLTFAVAPTSGQYTVAIVG